MKYKVRNSATRQKIILEAFKLFTAKPLVEITFADIEKATGLSRGGILHYFDSKEKLFAEIVEHFILGSNNDISIDPQKNIWENIKEFINSRKKQQECFANIGIYNVNRAHIYITINLMHIIDDMERKSAAWIEKELNYWRELLTLAQQKGEIKKNVNIDIEARIFLSVFFGNSYISINTPNGFNWESLQNQYYVLYNQIANQ